MIELHSSPTPNGQKVMIMLEETGLEWKHIDVNISLGEQFQPEHLKLNPNNKIPAIVDTDGPGGEALHHDGVRRHSCLPRGKNRKIPAERSRASATTRCSGCFSRWRISDPCSARPITSTGRPRITNTPGTDTTMNRYAFTGCWTTACAIARGSAATNIPSPTSPPIHGARDMRTAASTRRFSQFHALVRGHGSAACRAAQQSNGRRNSYAHG